MKSNSRQADSLPVPSQQMNDMKKNKTSQPATKISCKRCGMKIKGVRGWEKIHVGFGGIKVAGVSQEPLFVMGHIAKCPCGCKNLLDEPVRELPSNFNTPWMMARDSA
jgi:hypothetical protein